MSSALSLDENAWESDVKFARTNSEEQIDQGCASLKWDIQGVPCGYATMHVTQGFSALLALWMTPKKRTEPI